jgi:uncharacterized membrane protein
VALSIAGFLAWNSFEGGAVPGCGPESDCDKVLGSRWAYLMGFPVSLFAMPIYVLGLIFTFPRNIPWKSLLPVAFIILVGAAWFIGLQVFALRAFCKFCLAAHVAAIVAAIILIRKNPLPLPSRQLAAGIALALGVILAIAQVASPAPAPKQVLLPPTSADSNALPTVRSDLSNSSNFLFSIIRGQFVLDLRKVPVSGSLLATNRMAKLFDYTCHHCRDLHHLLEPIGRRHSNELVIVSLPMPLDASCNPVIKSTASAHANACEYSRLALAVFYAEPSKFHEFSNWLFQPERPPELNMAKQHAASLIGPERLEASLRDPRIAEQIRTNAFIYSASSKLGKSTAIPQMIFRSGAAIGAVSSAKQVEQILFDALGFRATNQPAASLNNAR